MVSKKESPNNGICSNPIKTRKAKKKILLFAVLNGKITVSKVAFMATPWQQKIR